MPGSAAMPRETKLCVLVSEETHYCIARAVQIMGWGEDGYVKVPVDAGFRLDPAALPAALEEARRRGRKPIAIVASAGTTATGVLRPAAGDRRLLRGE